MTQNYLLLSKKNPEQLDSYGAVVLSLQYFKKGQIQDQLHCCSGQPRKQIFRKAQHSKAGSGEPLPEGLWRIGDIQWAGGKDNYDGRTFSNGIGPVTIPLDFVSPGTTERSAIEIHLDWNRSKGYPGTIGCIGFYEVHHYRKLVSWLRDTDPRDLFVDWGLGSCPRP
jgi:lysozyme